MTSLTFLRTVQSELRAQHSDHKMSQREYDVVLAGQRYGVGPYDVAAQIIADRADAAE